MTISRYFLATIVTLIAITPIFPAAEAFASPKPAVSADAGHRDDDCSKTVKLSKEQKQTLNQLYDQMYNSNRVLLDKYVEVGAFTRRQADGRLLHLKRYVDHVKSHNFRWCSEDDDGEFEWFDDGPYDDDRHEDDNGRHDDDRYDDDRHDD